ncbi:MULTISPECIES: pyroglutamyl-peptidase I [unclassified Microbacterium]|uniref:pyroglutamyl-peptidase I n=1 Tax=unclassified Microbacterium TaxID=2609290 RepID=UPI00214AF665|nr:MULTISPECIES: pyroglutamyl-peptidase I [unclassified Microbacterium]MCR2801566.1 pyroglutamyl-peptidase I [Microbacterium sp. zg.Y818]MCR2827187.1 pyroglutamyl-peptidase I [Microbacterium sp. zg.Y909]WIM23157.1 pyroglutamyl-peptidase I [Microbacterium sp. zg-Y818]
MSTVLLTGFEPFADAAVNPSAEAVHLAADLWEGPEKLVTDVLPVTFAGAASRLRELIATHSPDLVIASGLAGGRSAVGIERIAVNLIDARIPDNDGAQPVDEPSIPGAPAAYFSTLPVKAIAHAVAAAGIPVEVSHSAGTFVCNHAMFVALHEAARRPGMRAGFVHVPWADGEGEPSLPLEKIAQALLITVRTALATPADVAAPGGALH